MKCLTKFIEIIPISPDPEFSGQAGKGEYYEDIGG
jgi:hypothetical protein